MGEETTNIMDERMNNSFSISFEDGQMVPNDKRRISRLFGGGGQKCEKSKKNLEAFFFQKMYL